MRNWATQITTCRALWQIWPPKRGSFGAGRWPGHLRPAHSSLRRAHEQHLFPAQRPLGYFGKTLIKEFINIDISTQFQRSDFGGELSPAQLKYCANDVLYLHKIHEELNKILERENRIDLYKDCLRFLKTRVNLDLALFKDDIWSH